MSQGQNNTDDGTGPLYVVGAILVVGFAIKMIWGDALLSAWLAVRHVWASFVLTVWPWQMAGLEESVYWMKTYYIEEWTGDRVGLLGKQLRPFMWPFFALPLAYLAFRVWAKNPGVKLRRSMNMNTLAESEARVWPWITPVLGKKIIEQPIEDGPWAMGLHPLEFARKYSLLDGQTLSRERAEKLFASQLGPLWEGPEKLRSSTRALFACFCAQACSDNKAAIEGLKTMALTVSSGKPDYSFAKGLLDKYYQDERIQAIVKRHAYVSTVVSSTLMEARKYGVLPPNFFLWLRPVNRPLWYTLNGVGRSTPFAEASGVHAHRLAEQVAGYGIELAYVTKCVDALEKGLKEVDYD